MKKYIITIIIMLSLFNCKKYDANGREIKDYDELEKSVWLLGTWHTETPDGNLKELWSRKNDSTFLGQSYFINKKDTIHFETINLIEENGVLLYITTIKGENQNLPTTFKFSETEENELFFENPKHDYPSKIIYRLKDSVNIDVTISGKQLGKSTSETFRMINKK